MTPKQEKPLTSEDRVETTEAGKTALQRKEEKQAAAVQEQKMADLNTLTLNDWYFRLRQFYPTAVVSTRPMSYDDRSPAMLPSNIHAWVAEVFERPQGLMIARCHGYAWVEEAPIGTPPVGSPQGAWQRAEERAEIAAISRVVPRGLEPPGEE